MLTARQGIIPARAGFTASVSSVAETSRDHPRSRGVYGTRGRRLTSRIGSSPLARGLPRRSRSGCGQWRIIPARAGFTSTLPHTPPRSADHPRSRGVYPRERAACPQAMGSSPLARGLPMAGYDLGTAWRIIPARAGFTYTPPRSVEIDSDHPRSRGVYCPAYQGGLLVGRIIPARAGFTSPAPRRDACPSDHPRSRGVYAVPWDCGTIVSGSSPLARGLHGPTWP